MEAVRRQTIDQDRQRAITGLARLKTPAELAEENAREEWEVATNDAIDYKEACRLGENTHFDGLFYWADNVRQKILRDDTSPSMALSRVAVCILEIMDPNSHPEWLPEKTRKKDSNGFPEKHKINVKRAKNCRKAFSKLIGIKVRKNNRTGATESVKLTGRQACDLPHICAKCADVESAKTTQKTNRIMRYAEMQGYDTIFITHTMTHDRYIEDIFLVDAFLRCFRAVRKDGEFEALMEEYGIEDLEVCAKGADIPYIKTLEATLGGPNGAHYHSHEVWFYDSHGNPQEAFEKITVTLKSLWEKYAVLYGLVRPPEIDSTGYAAFQEHGFKAYKCDSENKDSRRKMSEYITKIDNWQKFAGEWKELAEPCDGVYKLERGKGLGPYKLLVKISVSDVPAIQSAKTKEEKDAAWHELLDDMTAWTKYVCATWSRRIVDYSNGLPSWDKMQKQADAAAKDEIEEKTKAGLDYHQYRYFYNLGLVPYVQNMFMVLDADEGIKILNKFLQPHGLGECHSAAEVEELRGYEEANRREIRRARREFREWKEDQKQKAKEKARARKLAEREAERERKKKERERKKALARAPEQLLLFEEKMPKG